ncbi:MAG: signal peptidase I, partial [Planctomycetota bacterium]|nr:signal peptidase I [Planctomycetota bacterium]
MARSSNKRSRTPSGQRGGAPQGVGTVVRRDIMSFLTSKAVRETIESVVIAFALAFLFRTFEAEAFVIPTGSMAATLQGRHQDVECPMCGYDYRISASQEIDQATEFKSRDVAVGTCPNCRYTTCTNLELGRQLMHREEFNVPFNTNAVARGADSKSKSGDRILVNKFAYEFQEPERWDVFVFRYPGQSSRNYIKRLVGLPDETLKIHRGDIFIADYDSRAEEEPGLPLNYEIQRKPPHKIRAMMQIVHDNDHQAADLIAAG